MHMLSYCLKTTWMTLHTLHFINITMPPKQWGALGWLDCLGILIESELGYVTVCWGWHQVSERNIISYWYRRLWTSSYLCLLYRTCIFHVRILTPVWCESTTLHTGSLGALEGEPTDRSMYMMGKLYWTHNGWNVLWHIWGWGRRYHR